MFYPVHNRRGRFLYGSYKVCFETFAAGTGPPPPPPAGARDRAKIHCFSPGRLV